jgi:hypothetical protein
MAYAMAAINRNFVANFFQANKIEIELVHMAPCQLNRTQKPRLVNMRLCANEKRSTRDFMTILLERNSPLYRERIMRRKAMLHWFMRGTDNYENPVLVEKSALDGAIIDSLARARVDDILNEVECQFQFKLLGVSAGRL